MNFRLKFFLGTVFALFALTLHAQSLSPTGISASPGSALPGDSVTFAVTVNNSSGTPFGPSATANFTVVFTNISTGTSFTVGPVSAAPTSGFIAGAAVDPGTGAVTPGTGTFTLAATVPTQTTEAGNYSAKITINSTTNPTGAIGTGTFTVSSSVLTITGKPDLQITSLTYPAGTSYVGGNVIPMTLTFRNNDSTNGTRNVPYVPGQTGFPAFVRIQVVLSSNPTFGDADDFQLTTFDLSAATLATIAGNGGSSVLNADGADRTLTWNQLLPGNFTGSYYVLAKVDSLNQLAQNDPPALTVNGNNVWGGNALNPSATLINLLPSNFPTIYLGSHATGASTSAAGYSDNPSISADGRYVAFASDAANLVAGDTNGVRDIFIFDSQTTLIRRLSVSQQGVQGNAASNNPAISANGRYVAFASDANTLVLGDTNGFSDIYVVDTIVGSISRVSLDSSGTQANNPSFKPAISQTGRYIVFESTATNLVAGGTAVGVSHIYLRDRDVANTGTFDTAGNTATSIVDVTPAGAAGNGNSIQAAISADGAHVAFTSDATNLVASDGNGQRDVFVRDLVAGTTRLVSVANGTAAQGNAGSQTPSLSSDGHYVAFASLASNLVAGDTNGVSDIFVYDNTAPVATPVVVRVSVPDAGTGLTQGTDPSSAGFQLGSINPTISANGRYVAFASLDNNLTAGDSSGQYRPADANGALDIFVRDRNTSGTGTLDGAGNTATTMVSVNRFGFQTSGLLGLPSAAASNIYPVVSADGRFVAFPSDAENTGGLAFGATNQLPLDSNGLRDVFLCDRRTNSLPNPTTPPLVTITSPGSGNSVLVNTAIPVTASATTTIGVVASVQFYVNGTSLGTSTVFPYTQTWTPTAVGTFTLSALVTDSFGNQGISANVVVTVNAAPSVGITTPASGTTLTLGATQTVTATASPTTPGATISNVQFYVNGAPYLAAVTAAPYTVSWTPGATGSYALTAKATDSNGVQTTSPAVSVTVNPVSGPANPPGVVLSSPVAGASYAVGNTITIAASASLGTGLLQSVTFYANGVSIGTGGGGNAGGLPISTSFTPGAAGTYTFTAVATDTSGNQTTSAPVVVSVVAATAPTVAVSSPANNTTVPVNVAQSVTATAASSTATIVQVDFFANNVAVGSVTKFPYTVLWTPASVGSYKFTAVATDSLGVKSTSAPVTFVASAGTPPAVAITAPVGGSSYPVGNPVTVVASASSTTSTIATVQVFANGVSIGSKASYPYTFAWTPAAAGAYSLTALATDALGGQTTSAATTVTVGGNSPPAVSLVTPSAGQTYSLGSGVLLAASASDVDGTVASVQFFSNGILLGTVVAPPYTFTWVPQATGTFQITAAATDNSGNVSTTNQIAVTVTSSGAPTVALTAPTAGTYPVSTSIPLAATASGGNGAISQVQFLVNGLPVGTDTTSPYSASWTPTSTGSFTVVAVATDSAGVTAISPPVAVTISGNNPPTVAFTSPASSTTISAGNAVNLAAVAADSDGTVASVRFLANGIVVGTATAAPYLASWTPTAAGTYSVVAQATDNSGNVTSSAPLLVMVLPNLPPTVGLTSPQTGATVVVGLATTIAAVASDPDGTIANVQFYANGVSLGTDSLAPYSVSWTPTAEGYYRLTAVATDNSGAAITSATVLVVAAVPGSASIDTVASGLYINPGTLTTLPSSGSFSIVNLHGRSVTFIAYVPAAQTSTAARTYYFAGVPIDSSGNFQLTDNAGAVLFSGQFSASGATGSFADGATSVAFGGTDTVAVANAAPPGFYSGSVTGHPGSLLTGFVGLDSRLTLYVQDGTFTDAGSGAVSPTGGFSITTRSGNRFVGTADPATGLLTGTLTKSGAASADAFTGAQASGSTFSDGSLRNISSRGWVGTGDNTLIAGFVVSGTAPKQILLRAIGPTLTGLGVSGALANPVLYLFNHSGTQIASNDDWSSGGAAISTAAAQVGAFALPAGSLDSAILTTLAPGLYTTQVTGVGNTTGVALVELYDVDNVPAFSAEKMVNLSTRGYVGTGDNLLIAGFVVNGTSPKKVLVRGVGPTLANVGLATGYLADPVLRIVRANGPLIRENDNWGTGNDTGLVSDAAAKIGAFPLVAGSKDAAILLNLPPGIYTAELRGAGGSTGIGMIEVYEVQ